MTRLDHIIKKHCIGPYIIFYQCNSVDSHYQFETSNFSSEPVIKLIIFSRSQYFRKRRLYGSNNFFRTTIVYTKLCEHGQTTEVIRHFASGRNFVNKTTKKRILPVLYSSLMGILF